MLFFIDSSLFAIHGFLKLNMANSDKLNFNYAGFRLKTYIELKQL